MTSKKTFNDIHERIFRFRCIHLECDNRPFKVCESELKDAEGEIWCEICERICKMVEGDNNDTDV